MALAYAKQLSLQTQKTYIGTSKIEKLLLETFAMIITGFQVINKLNKIWFFQEIFLLANISIKMVLKISFFIVSNIDVYFNKRKLTWRSYTTSKALPITRQIKLIDKKDFAKRVLNKNIKAFVIHISFLSLELRIIIHLAKKA